MRLLILFVGHRCDNFIVGLTNVSPAISAPTLYNYIVCGQYPGVVTNGTTISLYCQDNLPPFRYLVLQLPYTGYLVACEVEVLVRGTRMSSINILIIVTQVDSCSMLLFLLYVSERLLIALQDLLDYSLTWINKYEDDDVW